ncbi:GNAT family N-acetyltransferase [Actinoplanes derwentensis]|uniref:Acetyltransferase (GNAT) family protein n=1 Tax=Actinoplanes derwentensis TaxID=113562 RepID=A0A1H1W8Y8_9ACTN|nr:GNAT family N-acetyltransferase [Actinoplanes derwentensis]GID84082.1 ribosomal-protein-alanine N-acetyltransferase [Actinoplanes derwentensis]SDS93110.1 Acetyltransferase (GNAT) family protein [Actinoplanes derwentensis]
MVVPVSRIGAGLWHALEDDLVVGRGEVLSRADGRMFVSIDAWHGAAFGRLAEVMLAVLPRPLHTVVAEDDADLAGWWRQAGFRARRREWEFVVPTDPQVTGLGSVVVPPGVSVKGFGTAVEGPLRELDGVVRGEVSWPDMPAEVLVRPVWDVSKFAVAAAGDGYVGLLRVAMVTRRPRIGLVAVRSSHRRRGVARALLAHTLGALHVVGKESVAAEVVESNVAATALLEGAGGRRSGSNLELVVG